MAAGKKKTIAFMLPSLVAGGAERVFVNLLKEFDRSRFYLHMIVIDPTGPYLKIIPNDILGISLIVIFSLVLLFWPFLDTKDTGRNIRGRPLLLSLSLIVLALWAILTIWGRYS